MERENAVEKLSRLEGKSLHELALEHDVTIIGKDGKVNKGWAGHAFERYLGLPINSAQSPNFGSWELKVIPIKTLKNGKLQFKETMAVTMIDPYNVAKTPFEESHLLSKLRKAVVVSRTVGSNHSEPSFVHKVNTLDLGNNTELYDSVRSDYELVRSCLLDENRGFTALTGKMGLFIQPRTKGKGHGSISRAFYARPRFLAKFIELE